MRKRRPCCRKDRGWCLLADDLSLVASTPAAEGWLAEVAHSDWPSTLELPEAVYAVAARLLALERGGHAPPDLMPRMRLRTASGRWLVLHASRLRAADDRGADSRHLRGGAAIGDRTADRRRLRPDQARGRDNTARPARALHRRSLRGAAHHAQHGPGSLQSHLRQGRRAQPQRTRRPGLRPALPAAHGHRSRTERRRVVRLSRSYRTALTDVRCPSPQILVALDVLKRKLSRARSAGRPRGTCGWPAVAPPWSLLRSPPPRSGPCPRRSPRGCVSPPCSRLRRRGA